MGTGGNGSSNDLITLDQAGPIITVTVDLGNDVPGTGAIPEPATCPPLSVASTSPMCPVFRLTPVTAMT